MAIHNSKSLSPKKLDQKIKSGIISGIGGTAATKALSGPYNKYGAKLLSKVLKAATRATKKLPKVGYKVSKAIDWAGKKLQTQLDGVFS